MSWQEYVDKNLMCPLDTEGGTLTSAALVGLDGSVWAQSPGFPAITPEEVGFCYYTQLLKRSSAQL